MLNLFHAGSSLGVNQSNIILIYAKNAKVTLMHVMPPLTQPDASLAKGGEAMSWMDENLIKMKVYANHSVRRMNQCELVYLYQPHIITTFRISIMKC